MSHRTFLIIDMNAEHPTYTAVSASFEVFSFAPLQLCSLRKRKEKGGGQSIEQ